MYDLYTVLENVVLFISKDLIYQIILPLTFVFLVFDIIKYMFSKESKREDIIEALQGKALGLVVIFLLPFIMIWFVNIFGKITGAQVDVDTSIIEKLISNNNTSNKPNTTTPNTATNTSPSAE